MLADLAAAIVVALLRYLQQRQDLRAAVRAEVEKECLVYANRANEWKANASRDPHALDVRVRSPGDALSIPDRTANDDGRTDLP